MGEREPAWATVQALARALGVSCEAFRVEDKPPEPPLAKKGKKRKGGLNG
jgi:hypothetical protein